MVIELIIKDSLPPSQLEQNRHMWQHEIHCDYQFKKEKGEKRVGVRLRE